MKLPLAGRMFAALFGMSGVMIALMVVWSGWALGERFDAYVSAATLAGMTPVAEALQQEYAAHGDWSGIAGKPYAWDAILGVAGPPPPGTSDGFGPQGPPGPPGEFGPGPGLGFGPPPDPPPGPGSGPTSQPGPPPGPPPPWAAAGRPHGRLALLDSGGHIVAGILPSAANPARRTLTVEGREAGTLLFETDPLPGSIEAAFLAERTRDLIMAAGAALLLSGLVAVLLARSILAPIRLVTSGAQRLAAGAFDTRLETGRGDELGDLLRDFNRLAVSLDRSEESRRRWVAETSHELRTPLAVMQAQVEAMQDGVHVAGPAALGSLHGEVLRMAKLVTDLHELARADSSALALQLAPVRPGAILREVLEGFSARLRAAGLEARAMALGGPDAVAMADPDRLRQVFGNLLENAVRYTDAGGRIEVAETVAAGHVLLRIDDTAPGVPDTKLPLLFERFFRVEASRNRRTGGSGLGLAICRAIVEAHDGAIEATASALGGLSVTVTLPCLPVRSA